MPTPRRGGITPQHGHAQPLRYVAPDGATTEMPYVIPKTTGGQTGHYQGVAFWLEEDLRRSLRLDVHDEEAFEFVRNVTGAQVDCGTFVPGLHTHARTPGEPASVGEDRFAALPVCLYGRCAQPGACDLNALDVYDGYGPKLSAWHRGSSFTEYGPRAGAVQRARRSWLGARSAPTGAYVEKATGPCASCVPERPSAGGRSLRRPTSFRDPAGAVVAALHAAARDYAHPGGRTARRTRLADHTLLGSPPPRPVSSPGSSASRPAAAARAAWPA